MKEPVIKFNDLYGRDFEYRYTQAIRMMENIEKAMSEKKEEFAKFCDFQIKQAEEEKNKYLSIHPHLHGVDK